MNAHTHVPYLWNNFTYEYISEGVHEHCRINCWLQYYNKEKLEMRKHHWISYIVESLSNNFSLPQFIKLLEANPYQHIEENLNIHNFT